MPNFEILSFNDHRVGAVCTGRTAAQKLQDALLNAQVVAPTHLQMLNPHEHEVEQKLEPQSEHRIAKSMLNWHLYLGSMGVILGFLIAGVLVSYGPSFTQANPYLTFIALLSPGLFLGLFASGLISLRPDKDAFNQAVMSKIAQGKWLLIVTTSDEAHRQKLMSFFRHSPQAQIINE
ncbi:hypothetical protein [Pseudoalteromonas piscicida]|uniref:hypothetical protein n=1 Tax=Pseudoalteromonas piscicida TaxID=43662 RepID=UPI0030B2D4F5